MKSYNEERRLEKEKQRNKNRDENAKIYDEGRRLEKEKERANALKQRERNVRLLRKRGIRSNLQARVADFILRIEIAHRGLKLHKLDAFISYTTSRTEFGL